MMRNGFSLTPATLLFACLCAPAGAAEPVPISDYMIMDVCVDVSDRILPTLIPGDPGCERRRDIRPGETPPYELRNFLNPGDACAEDDGTVQKLNRPVERDGETRIVSSTITLPPAPCGRSARKARPGEGGASIQWYDDGYGFIMGSYSPVAPSIYQTPLCRDGSRSSRRFFRGWVIAPAAVPAVGESGYGVFEGRLATGAASALPEACPTRYRRALTTWLVTPMRYTGGREMVSIVSSHFAQVSRDGLSPGNTLQVEETYWTREFGLSRWEKWAREDWVHPRSGRAAPDLARELYKRGRCGPPAGGTFDISPRTRFTDAAGSGAAQGDAQRDAYVRTILDPKSGESHLWYMTLCEDYTNVRPLPPDSALPNVGAIADPAYWAP